MWLPSACHCSAAPSGLLQRACLTSCGLTRSALSSIGRPVARRKAQVSENDEDVLDEQCSRRFLSSGRLKEFLALSLPGSRGVLSHCAARWRAMHKHPVHPAWPMTNIMCNSAVESLAISFKYQPAAQCCYVYDAPLLLGLASSCCHSDAPPGVICTNGEIEEWPID